MVFIGLLVIVGSVVGGFVVGSLVAKSIAHDQYSGTDLYSNKEWELYFRLYSIGFKIGKDLDKNKRDTLIENIQTGEIGVV